MYLYVFLCIFSIAPYKRSWWINLLFKEKIQQRSMAHQMRSIWSQIWIWIKYQASINHNYLPYLYISYLCMTYVKVCITYVWPIYNLSLSLLRRISTCTLNYSILHLSFLIDGKDGVVLDNSNTDDSSPGEWRTVRLQAIGMRFINGVSNTYDPGFPDELEGIMAMEDFTYAMNRINDTLIAYWPCTTCFIGG